MSENYCVNITKSLWILDALLRCDKSVKQIADDFGVSTRRVRTVAQRYGVDRTLRDAAFGLWSSFSFGERTDEMTPTVRLMRDAHERCVVVLENDQRNDVMRLVDATRQVEMEARYEADS